MSKKFKSQASSSRAATGALGGFGGFLSSGQGREPSSLTYVAEPPDLAQISDSQLAIAFKNFLKKDDKTRSKALDEIRDYVSSVRDRNGTLDDGFLDAWVKIYPRASIDLVRKVRQNAHLIQGVIATLVGKRIVRFLPKVIGPWLAGIYDTEKALHRTALESFTSVFSTDEKRSGVWKIYQSSILDFVDDVILQQTPLTLSDERTTKPDDAEAKYARVVGTAVFMLNRIIGNAPREDLEKDHTTIETLLCSKSLWALCYHEDSFVRKSIYTLLRSAASKEPGELDWKLVSAALIGKSLHASQLGSSSDLSETLLRVTFIRPQLWTDDYSGKTSSSKRLIQYIQKGSEGGLALFWTNLCQLLQIIPVQTLSKVDAQSGASDEITLSSASTLTESFQMGLNSRDEPRHNRPAGWKSYVDVAVWLTKLLPEGDRAKFLRERICPMVVQYVKPEQERRQWELPAQSAESICNESLAALALNGYRSELEKLFTELSEGLFDAVKLSAPEQSENFQSSQDAVCAQAERLLPMEAAVLSRVVESSSESQVLNIFKTTNLPLLENCLEVLRNRNGKPYGAAAVVEAMIRKVPLVAQTSQALLGFVQDDAPEILFSPSGDRLISIILSCRSWDGFGSSFEKVVERVAQFEPGASNAHAVQKLLSTLDFQEVDDKSGLHSLVMRALDQACRGSNLHWSIVIAVLQNQTSHGALTDSIFLSIVDALSEQSKVLDTLHGLSQVASSVGGAMRGFQSGSHGSKLTGKLLFLAESPSEEEASLAESLIKTLKNMVVGETTAKSSFEILRHNFDHVNGESLSIESLLVIAEELLHDAKPEDFARLSKEVLPARQTWETALQPFLELPPRLSTSVTSVLGGTVNLVDRKLPDSFKERYENVPRDSDHCSSAFRIASFTTRILSLFDVTAHLDTEQQEILFYNLPLSIQLIEDDLSIENSNGITGMELPEQREEYMEVVNEGRKVISGWTTSEAISSKIISFWQNKVEGLENVSPAAYRVGEAFAKVIDNVDGSHEIKSTEEITQLCRDTRNANAIWSASWVAVLRSAILANPAGNRLCNELVADSTGLKPEDEKKDGLRKLVLLNLLMPGNEDVAATIPTQRLMFLVKNLLQCLQSQNMPLTVQAEVYQALTYVLPCIQEMYGSHWEECMEILSVVWRETNGGDEALPVLFASFKLFDRLNSVVSNEDSNDDVKDAWAEKKTELCNALASTMRKFDPSTTFHAPRDVTVDLLCRLVNTIPVENLEDVSKFFSLLTTHSRTVQRAAYTVLHRYIPSTQEQVSFDVALSKSTVRLPYELMSLLLEAPNMKSISLYDGGDKVWSDIRSYLLSWKVVFDHFTNASATVQEQYVSSIRESDTLIPLLEFMFDFLQGSNGKLVDASKFDIRTFELDQSESDEKEIQWLLVHLYFLCLSHVAIIVKNWWIDSSNRIKNPVEAWTEKFVAPLVMEDALKGVTEWTSTQDPNEERALTVKISPKTAEIIASIPVDEESPPVSLSISLPAAYPLQPALVVGRSRVLVDERKWKSWLMIIQGVIMFANGNLVDGLLAFRRNVQGALKGQSECAICYSVISTDMQTPNKRCATCKNTFHSVCLFRWFKSSNQSTCPLCRNNFNFV